MTKSDNIENPKPPRLETLVIELTGECNERCKHCYIPAEIKSNHNVIPYEKICTIIDEFCEMGGENILFTGGEILLYSHLFDVLDYAHKKGLWIALFFNGISLSDKHINKFKDIGVNDIQVSLYSVNPDIHDAITKIKGSCERTKTSILRLIQAGLPVRIACSVLKDNMNYLCDLLDYCLNLDIKLGLEFNIIARVDKSNDNLQYRLSPEDLNHCLHALASHNPEFTKKFLTRIDRKDKDDTRTDDFLNQPICGAAQDILYITSESEYAVCPGWNIKDSNIYTHSSLRKFWENNNYLNEIRNIKELSFPKCVSCEALDYCARCFARNYLETGDYTSAPEFACEYAFIAKKIAESIN